MGRTRQYHTPEFKFQVVLEVLKEKHTVNEIAAEHQLHPNLITRWKNEFLESGANAIFVKTKQADEAEMLKTEFADKEAKLFQQIG
jgi:transposase-like protein